MGWGQFSGEHFFDFLTILVIDKVHISFTTTMVMWSVKSTRRAFCQTANDVFRGVYYLAKLCYETIYLQICDEIT